MEAMAGHQGVQFRPGDILILRVGFIPWYESTPEPEREELLYKLEFVGAKQGEDMQRWLWNKKFSAVAADSVGFECKSTPLSRLTRPQLDPCSVLMLTSRHSR
jgi:hypothetical protein